MAGRQSLSQKTEQSRAKINAWTQGEAFCNYKAQSETCAVHTTTQTGAPGYRSRLLCEPNEQRVFIKNIPFAFKTSNDKGELITLISGFIGPCISGL